VCRVDIGAIRIRANRPDEIQGQTMGVGGGGGGGGMGDRNSMYSCVLVADVVRDCLLWLLLPEVNYNDDEPDFGSSSHTEDGIGHERLQFDEGGMHCRFKVCLEKGAGWFFSEQVATEEIAEVLSWREEAVAQAGLSKGLVLPFEHQKQIQARHYRRWVEDPQNADKVAKVSRRRRGVRHMMHRDLTSMYRSWCYERFGGREWLYILIALGDIDDDALRCMNEALAQKRSNRASASSRGPEPEEASAASGQPLLVDRRPDAAAGLGQEAPATQRGPEPGEAPTAGGQVLVVAESQASGTSRCRLPRSERPGPVLGVQHQKSEAKRLRERARQLQKQFDKQAANWKGTHRQWYQMESRLEQAWAEAEKASKLAGVAYTDRHGRRLNEPEQDTSLVGRALQLYQNDKGRGCLHGAGEQCRTEFHQVPAAPRSLSHVHCTDSAQRSATSNLRSLKRPARVVHIHAHVLNTDAICFGQDGRVALHVHD